MDTTVNSNTLLANREQLEAQSKANRIANGLPALDPIDPSASVDRALDSSDPNYGRPPAVLFDPTRATGLPYRTDAPLPPIDRNAPLSDQLAQTRQINADRAGISQLHLDNQLAVAATQPAAVLREVVLSQHLAHSQRWHMAKMALESLEAALASLAALGHRFMAVPLQAPAIIEFPKVMYHDGLGTRTIESEAEAKALGDGWRDTPQVVEAKAPDTIAEAQRVEDARRADWPAGNPLSSEEAARRTAWDNEHRNAAPIVEFDPNRLTPGS